MKRILIAPVLALGLAGCTTEQIDATSAAIGAATAGVQVGAQAAADVCKELDRTKCAKTAEKVGTVGGVAGAAAQSGVTVLDAIISDSIDDPTVAKPADS
jgi:hypothetical protein